jgi:hypothetical protein
MRLLGHLRLNDDCAGPGVEHRRLQAPRQNQMLVAKRQPQLAVGLDHHGQMFGGLDRGGRRGLGRGELNRTQQEDRGRPENRSGVQEGGFHGMQKTGLGKGIRSSYLLRQPAKGAAGRWRAPALPGNGVRRFTACRVLR